MATSSIKPIDGTSVHRITSGQVVIDLQTAVKELVENSLDAGATSIEVRFKQYGVKSVEVIDNGCGIAEDDYDSIALKHHTSKLSSFSDLTTIRTFGFRGEALSSLCALCESVALTTATQPPMGVSLEMERSGKVGKRGKVARQRGTTITLTNLFLPLPVRRKEFERNHKREFGKALALLNAYALGPCCGIGQNGVRLTVSNQVEKGPKTVQIRTPGTTSSRASVSALWGPKALDNIVDLDLSFIVERDKLATKRLNGASQTSGSTDAVPVVVKGLVSKFAMGCGRTGTDRQFFYVNGRPCNLSKIQKAFNEVYRSFNATQAPFVLADFIIPTDSCDINVSPDKRTIFLHSEGNLISALKAAMEESFAPSRSTYDVGTKAKAQSLLPGALASVGSASRTHARSKSTLNDAAAIQEDSTISTPPDEPPAHSSPLRPALIPEGATDFEPQRLFDPDSEDEPLSPAAPLRPETNDTVINEPVHEGGADVDGAHTITVPDAVPMPAPVKLTRVNESVMVVDTSKASWNRKPGGGSRANESELEGEGPQRKKRRSDFTAASDIGVAKAAEIKHFSGQGDKHPRASLRTQLVGFARTGSQVVAVDSDEEVADEPSEDNEDQLDTSNDEGAGQAVEKTTRRFVSTATTHDTPMDVDDVGGEEAQRRVDDSSNLVDLTDDCFDDSPEISLLGSNQSITTSLASQETILRPEVIRSADNSNGDISLRFNIHKVASTWGVLYSRLLETSKELGTDTPGAKRVPSDAGLSNTENDDRAVDALSRVIDKGDFASMDIIGQFNLGFIVARRRKHVDGSQVPCGDDASSPGQVMDDLFIVDQHAADEKYNFETLQQTTNIQSQKLFRPKPLELTAADELLAIENMSVLQQNGFEVQVDEDCDLTSAQGGRLKLTAQPVSKSTVFDMKDLEELIHLMRDRPTGQMIRCSKARAMFAMRACRKSVMIGMPLNKHQMSAVVQHMGTMDQPWNCPHGRPTMRHLLDITSMGSQRYGRNIDWSAFDDS